MSDLEHIFTTFFYSFIKEKCCSETWSPGPIIGFKVSIF